MPSEQTGDVLARDSIAANTPSNWLRIATDLMERWRLDPAGVAANHPPAAAAQIIMMTDNPNPVLDVRELGVIFRSGRDIVRTLWVNPLGEPFM